MKKDYVIIILIGLVVALMATTVVLITRDADKKEEVIEDVAIAEPIVESKEETKAPAIATRKEEPAQEPKEEVAEESVQEEPIEEEFDQFEMYVIDEDWIAEHNNGVCILERDGKLYGVNTVLPGYIVEKYNIGWQYGMPSSDGVTSLWMSDGKIDVPTNASNTLTSAGDFPVFQVKCGEQLRLYATNGVPTELKLTSADFYGYTIMATEVNFFAPMDEHTHVNGTFASETGISNVQIADLNGNPVDDVRDLEYGQEYIYSWFKGTQYDEKQMIANSKTFILDSSSNISLSVEPTKEGYFVADTSELPLGFYAINRQALFEVVDEFHD